VSYPNQIRKKIHAEKYFATLPLLRQRKIHGEIFFVIPISNEWFDDFTSQPNGPAIGLRQKGNARLILYKRGMKGGV
jgi:hypothetical protein